MDWLGLGEYVLRATHAAVPYHNNWSDQASRKLIRRLMRAYRPFYRKGNCTRVRGIRRQEWRARSQVETAKKLYKWSNTTKLAVHGER